MPDNSVYPEVQWIESWKKRFNIEVSYEAQLELLDKMSKPRIAYDSIVDYVQKLSNEDD